MPTVVELKALAKKQRVKLPHNASKDEIIKKLKGDTMEKENHKSDSPHKSEKADSEKVEHPTAGKSDKGKSSGETRSFQTGGDPARKEDLTREEAEKKGLFWGDITSQEAGRSGQRTAPPAHEVPK